MNLLFHITLHHNIIPQHLKKIYIFFTKFFLNSPYEIQWVDKTVNPSVFAVFFLSHFPQKLPCGCPGTLSKTIEREKSPKAERGAVHSQLSQWPCQIKLAPVNAPYFDGANLLIAADCTAYAYGSFHNDFIRNHITLIGCPKLDAGDYTEKLTEIIKNNDIKSVKVVRMEVPCCSGIENAVKRALMASGKFIPWQVVVISTDGRIID